MLYIARQPIFDKCRDIVAYELLYRDPNTKTANFSDADEATNSVLAGSALVASFEQLVGDKRAFINFTKNLIKDGTPLIFPNKLMTIEILEDIVPDEEFIIRLRELKEKGYTLALDDFTLSYPYEEVINLADILKVDFLLNTPSEQLHIINKYRRPGLKFLAEKVETSKDFDRAKSGGYDYFQGYYFAKPSLFKYKDIASLGSSHFEALAALDTPHPNYTQLTAIIEKDLSLTYKLFKYANSPFYGGSETISTVRGALVRLGFENIRNWLYLIVLRSIAVGQSPDLISVPLQRAKMMESIAEYCGLSERSQECFLVGLFSMLDVLTNKPLDKTLEDLPLPDETKEAIIYKENLMGQPLKLTLAYEKADWSQVHILCKRLKVSPKQMFNIYMKALKWATTTSKIAP